MCMLLLGCKVTLKSRLYKIKGFKESYKGTFPYLIFNIGKEMLSFKSKINGNVDDF